MERIIHKPPIIIEVENEILKGNTRALKKFWSYINDNGNPIVEDIFGNDEYKIVTLIYKGKEKLENVVLIPPVGMRKLENHVMEKVKNTDIWYISYKVRKDICFTYEFSCNDPLNNDWNRRWKNVKGDMFNKNVIIYINKETKKERKVPFVMMKDSKKRKYIQKNADAKEGTLYEHKIISENLNEQRKVYVYVPYGYDKDKDSCGVVVLNDGDQYIKTLQALNVFDNLMYKKEIPEVIAVFIDSDKNRAENMQCSHKYARFIGEELISFLKDNYSISLKPEKNVIGGYSLGGLFAAYMGMKYSNIFGNVLSQSGSYWYKRDGFENRNTIWINEEYKKMGKLNLKFYINVGAIEPQVSMKNTNIEFKDYLIRNGYDVKFEEFSSGHDYIYWGETLADGLKYLL